MTEEDTVDTVEIVDETAGGEPGVGRTGAVAAGVPVDAGAPEGVAPPGVSAGWVELVEHARRLGPDPALAGLDDGVVVERVRTEAAELAAATCRWLELVAELVVRDIWAAQGAASPAQWLSWAVGVASSTAREQVRVALALRSFPATRARFAAGTLSYSKVRAITRLAEPALEERLLALADATPAAQLDRIVGSMAGVLGAREPADVRRGWSRRTTADGDVEFRLRVPGDTAGYLDGLVERFVAVLDRDGHPQEVDADHGGPDGGPGVREPIAARRADAVVHALEVAATGLDVDTSGLDRTTLVVHVEGTHLTDGVDVRAGSAYTHGSDLAGGAGRAAGTSREAAGSSGDDQVAVGAPAGATTTDAGTGASAGAPRRIVPTGDRHGRTAAMSVGILRRLACDAGVVLITLDADGLPIDVGRRERRISAALRRALRQRDPGCRFPGCGATRHLHAHHIWHWADGGPTDLDNLVLLCSTHHRWVHDHGWRITYEPGRLTFAPPGGRPRPATLQLAGADPDAIRRSRGSTPDRDALQPDHWYGEPLRLADALDVLTAELDRYQPLAAAA